jgi:ribose 5-phosphate isomerase RpiB
MKIKIISDKNEKNVEENILKYLSLGYEFKGDLTTTMTEYSIVYTQMMIKLDENEQPKF